VDSRAVSILCIACGNTDLPSLVPIKIWKLSEYPRVVPGPNGQAIEVSQPIVPPIYRDLDDDDDSEDEADCSLGDVHTNWDQYLAALHQFNSRVLMYYQAQAAGRKSTLVFCSRIHAVHELEKHFHAAGIDTRSISSRTIESERNSIVNSFRKGEFPVLINCMMLIEGYDAPQVNWVDRSPQRGKKAKSIDRLHCDR